MQVGHQGILRDGQDRSRASGYRVPMRHFVRVVRVVRVMIDPERVALTPHGPATIQPWSICARLGRQIGVLEITSGKKARRSGKIESPRCGRPDSMASKSWMRFHRTEV